VIVYAALAGVEGIATEAILALSPLDEQSAVQNLSCDSFSIILTTNLSPTVDSFVVDPGYSTDHY